MNSKLLHQVQVKCCDGKEIFVGPRVDNKDVLIPLVQSINTAVAAGKERDWRDAHIADIPVVVAA